MAFVLLAVALMVLGSLAESPPALVGTPTPFASVETANIPIGGYPRTIAVNPNASRIYVADWFSDILTVVDASSHLVIASVPLPAANNNGIAIDYNTDMVYVSVEGGIAEINGTTNKVTGELPLDFGQSLAYDPSTHTIYGSSGNMDLVGADVRTGSVVANISLGHWANSLAIDPYTNMIYAVGCSGVSLGPCGLQVSIVNGTSRTLLRTVHLGSNAYSRVTMDVKTDIVYVFVDAQLVALNGTNGKVIYYSNPQICGAFDSIAAIPSSNEVLAVPPGLDYLLVYDGASGALVNMYSLPSPPQYVTFNPNTNEIYVTLFSGQLLAFHSVANVVLVRTRSHSCNPP